VKSKHLFISSVSNPGEGGHIATIRGKFLLTNGKNETKTATHGQNVAAYDMAGVVEQDVAEAALGQRHVEFILHGVEQLAGMGRGVTVMAGGFGEALGDRHVTKHANGTPVPAWVKYRISSAGHDGLLWEHDRK